MRSKRVKIGQFVQFRQRFGGQDNWLPFLVTHVYSTKEIGGVAFSATPQVHGWGNRAATAFNRVERGTGHGQWRFANKDIQEGVLEDANWNTDEADVKSFDESEVESAFRDYESVSP